MAVSDDNREKKYTVGFIGDNTHSILPRPKLANFIENFKEFSKTKKKTLLDSIRKAKEIYEAKFKNISFDLDEESANNKKSESAINNNNNNNSSTIQNSGSNNASSSLSNKDKDSNYNSIGNINNIILHIFYTNYLYFVIN